MESHKVGVGEQEEVWEVMGKVAGGRKRPGLKFET